MNSRRAALTEAELIDRDRRCNGRCRASCKFILALETIALAHLEKQIRAELSRRKESALRFGAR